MSKGNFNCECPFGECENVVCDFMGIKHEEPVIQCPIQIFNKCQSDIALSKEDIPIIEEAWRQLREKHLKETRRINRMIKLSECTKEGQVFLYGGETVGLQYILRMIWNGETLPEIRLVYNDENFSNAVSDVLHQMYQDVQNGVDKEEYELNDLNTNLVEVDITKENIKQISEYAFEIV